MDTNLIIAQTYNQIIKTIEESKLSPGAVFFILKDICKDVENLFYQTANQEIQKIQTEEIPVTQEDASGQE